MGDSIADEVLEISPVMRNIVDWGTTDEGSRRGNMLQPAIDDRDSKVNMNI